MAAAEQLLFALRRTQSKGGGTPSEVFRMVREWKGMNDIMVKSLMDTVSDVESREENLRVVSELLETGVRDLEERERQFKVLQEGKSEELRLREEKLDEQLRLVHEHIESLEASQKEVEVLRLKGCEKLKEIEKKERELDSVSNWWLEKRLSEVEKREKDIKALHDGKLKELALKEEAFGKEKMEFVEERLRNEKLAKRLSEVEKRAKELKTLCDGKLKELTVKEEAFGKEKMEFVEEVRLRNEKHEERLSEVEKREKEFEMLYDGKLKELTLKEEAFGKEMMEFVGEVRLRNEKHEKRLSEVERREKEFETLYHGKLKELTLKEEAFDKEKMEFVEEVRLRNEKHEERLSGVEKREKEFETLYHGKLKELTLKEEAFGKEKMEFAEEVRLTNKKLKDKQKLGCSLIERLEMTLHLLCGMKVLMDEKFKEIESREAMAHEYLTSRLNEADLIGESLEKRFKELEDVDKELGFFQVDRTRLESREKVNSREEASEKEKLGLQMLENKPEENKQELGSKRDILVSCKKEHDYEEQDLGEDECIEKSLNTKSESPQNYVKENLALSKLDEPQRHSVGKDPGLVADKGQQVCRLGDVDLKQSMLTDNTGARLTIKQEKSSDFRHALQKEQKALEMLVNDPKKGLELMDDEIYQILSLSSDPGKVVLDVVKGFRALRSSKLVTECRVKRATILLLDQLTKISPKIQPCVTDAAIKFALYWKSKMSTTTENPMEVSGFLRLLAAYNLSSFFDKNELFNFLKLAAQHEHTPGLCHTLGLTTKIPGLIHKLINEKQFLLASTYVYEYKLQDKFPQTSILSNYVAHSKQSANAKCRREDNSSEARDKAIASEIVNLQLAIEHIIKYGLESDYSTNALTTKIKQLEVDRSNLRHGSPIPILPGAGNKKAKRKAHGHAAREFATAQMPCHGSNSWSTPGWIDTRSGEALLSFSNPWGHVDEVPMPQSMAMNPCKRSRRNMWPNRQQQFS